MQMLDYVVAVATAVTISIFTTPAQAAAARDDSTKAKPAKMSVAAPAYRMLDSSLPSSVVVDGSPPAYRMSRVEQEALRKALMRSVKFIDSVR